MLRFKMPFSMLAYPFYLWSRSTGKSGVALPPQQRSVPDQREQGRADVDGVMGGHGRPPRWPHLCHGASADDQALRCPLLCMYCML
uniref:Omega-3 fatty acid desaturase n=1 Tax=Arundo donax TaxID=35708 RepID=A0A0A8ZHC2_ARUDO